MGTADQEAIRQVIEEAYIEGIHQTQDPHTARGGFHSDFAMLVKHDGGLEKVTLDQWFPRIEKMKAANPDLWSAETTHHFELIDVAGDAAVAKLDVFRGETHFSTDYMLLYRFEAGWQIVSKVFSVPG